MFRPKPPPREVKSEYYYHRGNLQIPIGATIYRSEPAIDMTTKPDTVFYFFDKLHGVTTFDPKLLSPYEDRKGTQTVLVRPLVETWKYQGEEESPPLQFDNIRQVALQIGKSHLQRRYLCVYTKDLVEPDEKQSATVFKKIGKDADIFPTQPSKVQVRQHTIGNCFLLAPVMAILSQDKGYQFFLDSMKQLKDGTTIVRFFDPSYLTPVYVQVTNSTCYQQGEEVIFHDAPWVHILEKAYVAFHGLQQQYDNRTKSIYLFPNFETIEQNSTMNALKILTGKPLETLPIQDEVKEESEETEDESETISYHEKRNLQQQHPVEAQVTHQLPWFFKEKHIFNFLQNKLKEGHVVVASSLQKLPNIKEASGITGKHAYAVIDVYEKQGNYMISLRNPWGFFGQFTDKKRDKKEDVDIPEFEMTINDFMKVFRRLTIGSFPKPPALERSNTPRAH
jgi:hypothetical protein